MKDSLPTFMRRARQYMMAERYEEAIDAYQRVLKHEGMQTSEDVCLRLAWCYEKLEYWHDAVAMYESVIQMYQLQGKSDSALFLEGKIQAMCTSKLERYPILDSEKTMDFPALLLYLKSMGELLSLEDSDVLCEAGDPPDVLWLLESGCLGVQLPEYLQDGEDYLTAHDGLSVLVGELGFFTQQRRSAKVWSQQNCAVYQIKTSDIDACPNHAFQLAMHELLKHYWIYPILSKHAIFERINEIDRKALCDLFVSIDLAPGTCLIQHGENHDGAYLLQQGCLFFIYESETGKEQVNSVFPGDMVNLGGLLHAYHANYEVRAATSVRLLHLSRQSMETFIKHRSWMIDILLRYSRRAAWLQIMHPDDAYLWMTNREIQQRRVNLSIPSE